eukprot:m.105064 g.105064  ORF g.105064 m.105064 type:complete len:893 (-) comp27617_c1_seq1:670-3348(-)
MQATDPSTRIVTVHPIENTGRILEVEQLLDGESINYTAVEENTIADKFAKLTEGGSAIFVLDNFDGATFTFLQENNCRIIGAPLAESNICDGTAIDTMKYRVQYTNVMHNVKVHSATGSNEPNSSLVEILASNENSIRWMGGEITEEYVEETTHVVATMVNETVRQARRDRKPVLQLYWVEDCYTKSCASDFNLETTYKGLNTLPTLAACAIYLDPEMWQVGKTRDRVRDMAESTGAHFVTSIDEASHYITNKIDDRYHAAKQNKKMVVPAKWLISCVTQKSWLPEEDFALTLDTSVCQTPNMSLIESTQTPSPKRLKITHPTPASSLGSTCESSNTIQKTESTSSISVKDMLGVSTFDPVSASSPFVKQDSNKRKREDHVEEQEAVSESLAPESETNPIEDEAARAIAKHRYQFLEMLEKEESFLADISTITDLFLERLKEKSVGLDKVDLDQLFANVLDIKVLTVVLVQGLKGLHESNTYDQADAVCGLFDAPYAPGNEKGMSVKEFLRVVYKRYVAGHDKARDLYQTITKPGTERKYQIAQFKIKALETDARCHRQSLVDLLMLPVQHLMRYSLHLKDLAKSTPDTQPETHRTRLRELVQFFEQTMSDVNSAQAGMESSAQLYQFLGQIQDFSASCFKFGRRYVGEVRCKLMGGEKPIKTMVFLMNDSLIVAERKDGSRTSKMKGTLITNFGLKEHAPYKFHSFYSLKDWLALEVDVDEKLAVLKISPTEGPVVGREVHFQCATHHDNRAFLKRVRDQRTQLGIEMCEEEHGDERTFEQDLLDFEALATNPLSPSEKENDEDVGAGGKRKSVYSRLRKMTSKVNIKLKRTPSRATLSRFHSTVASKSSLVNVKRSKSFEDRSKLGDKSKPLMKRMHSTPRDTATWASTK